MNILDKIPEKILMKSTPEPNTGCWLWTGYINKSGYGIYCSKLAHRIAYEYAYGEIDPSLVIDHLCRTRPCINPYHLEQVTIHENQMRGYEVTKKFCVNGHERNDKNSYYFSISKTGKTMGRKCRLCNRVRVAEYKMRNGI